MNDEVLKAMIAVKAMADTMDAQLCGSIAAEQIRIVIRQMEKFQGAIGAVLAEADTYDGEYADGYRDAIEKVFQLCR